MRARDEPEGYAAMASLTRTIRHLAQSAVMLCRFVITAAGFLRLCLRSPMALAAENLFLRKQLALYQERHVTPWRATDATRLYLATENRILRKQLQGRIRLSTFWFQSRSQEKRENGQRG